MASNLCKAEEQGHVGVDALLLQDLARPDALPGGCNLQAQCRWSELYANVAIPSLPDFSVNFSACLRFRTSVTIDCMIDWIKFIHHLKRLLKLLFITLSSQGSAPLVTTSGSAAESGLPLPWNRDPKKQREQMLPDLDVDPLGVDVEALGGIQVH